MKWLYYLPIVVISGLLLSCKHLKDPEFRRLEKFKVKKIGLQEAIIGLNIVYFNPNNFSVSAKNAELNVYIDSLYFGKFTQDSAISVHQGAEFSIPVTGIIPIQQFLKIDFQNIGQREINLRANGFIKLGKTGIYITRPIQYEGNHRLTDIKLQ